SLPDTERDLGEKRTDVVGLGHPLEVDQVAHATTWAPATGPCATSTTRVSSAAVRVPATWRACSPDSHRKTQVGPDPDTRPRRAPASTPSTISLARSGRRSQA